MKLSKIYKSFMTLIFSSAIIGGGVLAYTQTNVDKLDLLNRAVADNTVGELANTRSDIMIAAGYEHSGAVIDNKLYMWGSNQGGQLGIGNIANKNTPQLITLPSSGTITHLSLGNYHSGAVVSDKLYMWGSNQYGQLGLGNNTNQYTPQLITLPSSRTINHLSLGAYHSAVVINDYNLYTWGSNGDGQLGHGNKDNLNRPKHVTTGIYEKITHLSLGGDHSGAVADNKLYMWGRNDYWQLCYKSGGVSKDNDVLYPGLCATLPSGNITDLSLGYFHSGVIIDGNVYLWGSNSSGECHRPNSKYINIEDIRNPTGVTSGGATKLELGEFYSGAVVRNRTYTWGSNDLAQLGNGKFGGSNRIAQPVLDLPNSSTHTNLSLGGDHSISVADNKLYTWGRNDYGQLGLGNYSSSPFAKQLTSLKINYNTNINLDSSNDRNNIRNKIIYDVTEADIRSLIDQSQSTIGLTSWESYTINNINYNKATLNSTKKGQIIVDITSSANIINITINGFKPAKDTQNIIISEQTIPTSDNTFKGLEINDLVAKANADSTGITNPISKWVINNQALFIGDVSIYNENFPKNTKITKVNNFQVVTGLTGTISFDIYVDKYYKKSGSDLIKSTTSDLPIKLTNKVSVTGLAKTQQSILSVNPDSDRNYRLSSLLDLFGNPDGTKPITGNNLVQLKNYINGLDNFPLDTQFIIRDITTIGQDPTTLKSTLKFRIEVNKYFDNNGILQNEYKIFPDTTNKFVIDNLFGNSSSINLKKDYDINMTVNDLLTLFGIPDGTTPMSDNDILQASRYFDGLNNFPANTQIIIKNINISLNETTNKMSLSFQIQTSKYYDSNGNAIDAIKLFPNDTSKYVIDGLIEGSSRMSLKTTEVNNVVVNDLLTSFGYVNENTAIPTANILELKKYINGLDSFPINTQFYIKNNEGIVDKKTNKVSWNFQIEASQYFDQTGKTIQTPKLFPSETTKFSINNFNNIQSNMIIVDNHPILTANAILKDLKYINENLFINKNSLKKYLNLDTFPSDAQFRLTNVVKRYNSLTFDVIATKSFNVFGQIIENQNVAQIKFINLLPNIN